MTDMNNSGSSFTVNGLILWLVLSSVLCGTGAVLKTLYADKLCYRSSSTKLYLRYQNSAILTSVPNRPLDCQITLQPERHCSVVIAFHRYSLGLSDSLVFQDRYNFQLSLAGKGFFLDERKSIFFEGPLTIHIVTNNTYGPNRMKFQLVYTQVHDAPCDFDEFKCRNNKCIPMNLTCDTHNHCGDVSGQEDCNGPKEFKKVDLLPYKKSPFSWKVPFLVVSVILGIVSIVLTAVLIRIWVLRKKETRIKQSFLSGCPVTAPPLQTASAPEHTPQNYEIPSIYPHLTAAPDLPEVGNPELKSEE